MTGTEYIGRLIEDIKNSIEIRGKVRSVNEQIQLTALGHNDLNEFVSALNVQSFDAHVDIVAQFLGDGLLTHVHGDKLDLSLLLDELIKHEDAIIQKTNYILEGNMLSTTGDLPSDMLIQQLDWVHQYSK